MKVDQKGLWKIGLVAGAVMALVAGVVSTVPNAYAGGTIKADDDKWISIGMGTRLSFNAVEDGSGRRDGPAQIHTVPSGSGGLPRRRP